MKIKPKTNYIRKLKILWSASRIYKNNNLNKRKTLFLINNNNNKKKNKKNIKSKKPFFLTLSHLSLYLQEVIINKIVLTKIRKITFYKNVDGDDDHDDNNNKNNSNKNILAAKEETEKPKEKLKLFL
jgi:hypothetical protein